MNRKDEIGNAYKKLGNVHSVYDGMMTGSTKIGRMIDKVVWRMSPEQVIEYPEQVFSVIPENFAGRLLEVPVGTGILSMPVWKTLPDADITCLDYSEKMMQAAAKRAEEMEIKNITFVQGDVGALPFADESFDVVVSMNGFHAFPDKEAAYRETYRVLKPGGLFCGCFYVEGNNTHTDRLISAIYRPAGFFTGPFETMLSLKRRLENMYDSVRLDNVNSIAVFSAVKNAE